MQRTIGQNLRAARESAGLTLLDVAHRTRIPANRLQQLEDGNYAAFGSMAYAKSFLKGYSRFLNVDASDALEELPTPVLGGPADYRYLTASQGPWIEKRERPQRRREPLTRPSLSPIPTLVFMFVVFVVTGALLATHLAGIQKVDRKATNSPAVESGKQAPDGKTSETQGLKNGALAKPIEVSIKVDPAGNRSSETSAKGAIPDQETVVRPAVLPSSIPAPVSPNTPVRKAQIVD
jgi:cytoskeletal protein RodZ